MEREWTEASLQSGNEKKVFSNHQSSEVLEKLPTSANFPPSFKRELGKYMKGIMHLGCLKKQRLGLILQEHPSSPTCSRQVDSEQGK